MHAGQAAPASLLLCCALFYAESAPCFSRCQLLYSTSLLPPPSLSCLSSAAHSRASSCCRVHAAMALLPPPLPHRPSAFLQSPRARAHFETSPSKTHLAEISGRSILLACLIPVCPSPHRTRPLSPPGSHALHRSSRQYSAHENKTLHKHSFSGGHNRGSGTRQSP